MSGNGIFFSCSNSRDKDISRENVYKDRGKKARVGQVITQLLSTTWLFQKRWWPEESPLTTKFRKHRGNEGRKEEEMEEGGIISDSETEFVMGVFISFMYNKEQKWEESGDRRARLLLIYF